MPQDLVKFQYKIILEWVGFRSSVLDLGCGDGELLSVLIQEKKVSGHGIDINEQAIYDCVKRGLSVSHEDLDTGLSEYPDRSFDYVILNQSLQEVRKPDFVLKEATRVGKKVIVSFPNFAYYVARIQISFRGKVPVTSALPYTWYDTPNLHFLSILDFIEYCNKRGIKIEKSVSTRKDRRVRFFPNLFAEIGFFLLSR